MAEGAPPLRGKSRVAAVVLAAGASRRFIGGSKLLADVAGRPLIAWTVAAFTASRAAQVVVVTGPDPAAVEAVLSDFPVTFAHNPDHRSGMGGSIAVGVSALGAEPSGALICPGDMPGVTGELIDQLISAFETGGGERIVRPVLMDGRPGHPVLWPRRHFPRLVQLQGPVGGKALLAELAGDVDGLTWSDPAAALDIDTVEDLERYRQATRDLHGR